MPKYGPLYRAKRPLLQMKILRSIALNGILSQKEAATKFRCKSSTISEAFKIMTKKTRLIESTRHPDLERRLRREKFSKLSGQGLSRFIKENPSPYDFWVAMIRYGTLNSKDADRDEFNQYYDLFIQVFIGNYLLRSCFFLGNLFENLFQRWRKEFEYDESYASDYIYHMFRHDHEYYMQERRRKETQKAYKVLECLLLNRGITIDKIIELTKLGDEEVTKVIDDYSMTQTRYSQYIDEYGIVYQSSRSENVTIDFLNHLLIVHVRTKKEEKRNNGKDENYELSLLGVLLVLATISLKRSHWEETSSYSNHYDKAASNYQEKLPLIFGKWRLLKKTLDFDKYPSIFDYLLGNYKSEILSLPVSLGGNKEIYDNIRSAGWTTIIKFSTVYDKGIHALQSADYPEESRNTMYIDL
jgi:hypothetical protein